MTDRLVLARDLKPGMTALLPRRALRWAGSFGYVAAPDVDRSVKAPFTVASAHRDPGGIFLVGTIPNAYEGHPPHLVTFYSAMSMEPYKVVEA